MRPRMVRSPVDICFGTRPSQAAKSRPLQKAEPLPIAATMALEMIGPIPGTVINCWQPSSVSVRKHFESFESFVIHSGDLIREGHHRCGQRRTADVTTAANCGIRVT